MFNLAEIVDRVADRVGDRPAIIFRDRRISYRDLVRRADRVAGLLHKLGLGCHRERAGLADWESGQDLLALYLYNGNEYLEAMLGAFKARVAPFNVNYRYVDEELIHLLNSAGAKAILYHRSLAHRLASIRDRLPLLQHFIEVDDGEGTGLPDAIHYEPSLAVAPGRPGLVLSPDDLYVLFTGGTTGLPKGVLWRQADMLVSVMGGRRRDGSVIAEPQELANRAEHGGARVLPAPPFMHAAGQWIAFTGLIAGNTLVIPNETRRLEISDLLDTIEREQVQFLSIVGDAFGRPLADALRSAPGRATSLRYLLNSGAALSGATRRDLLEALPAARILDVLGSTEGGNQGQHERDGSNGGSMFEPSPASAVLNEDRRSLLAPGHDGIGWWARRRYVPLGYLNEPAATAKTFVSIDGERFSVPGDRARLLADGRIQLLGRDSLTINSGGEKIFVEEVEAALKQHPAVDDALVVSRPSERWGDEVVAVIQPRAAASPSTDDILRECARHIARYKLPKHFVFVGRIERGPNGKPDYSWAREIARLDSVTPRR